jgi:hypothetical protein
MDADTPDGAELRHAIGRLIPMRPKNAATWITPAWGSHRHRKQAAYDGGAVATCVTAPHRTGGMAAFTATFVPVADPDVYKNKFLG